MMLSVRAVAYAAFSFVVVASSALAQEPASPRPKPQFLQQNEDWSDFRAGPGAGVLDKIKHMDLGEDGWAWLSLGGRADTRFESWDGFGFGATSPGNQDSFLLTRALFNADLHLGENVRFWVEGKTAQSTDRNLPGRRRIADVDTLAMHQAFADFTMPVNGDDSLRLRVGRQSFLFGTQRLISPLPWANTLRTWDGVSAEFRSGPWSVQGFVTQFVPVRTTQSNRPNNDLELYGVYATRKPDAGERGYDVYFLGTTRPNLTLNSTTGNERRHTVGGRTWGPLRALGDGFDGEVEAAYQFGEVGSNNIEAWSVTGLLGHSPADWRLSPRFFVGVDAASGDSSPGGTARTFQQLYPLGHAYFGWADIIGRQNVFAVQVGASLKLTKATTAKIVGHAFRLMTNNDGLYGANGKLARTGLGSRDVAQEVDLLVTHKLGGGAKIYGGYSYVFGGGGLVGSSLPGASSPTSAGDDISFFYLGASWVF